MPESTPTTVIQKVHAITKAIEGIDKSGKNPSKGYSYTPWGEVQRAVRDQCLKHGLVILPEILDVSQSEFASAKGTRGTHTRAQMQFTLVNVDDPNDRQLVSWFGEAEDYDDKSTQQAASNGTKYLFLKLFQIPEDVTDTDGQESKRGYGDTTPIRPSATRPGAGAQQAAPAPGQATATTRPSAAAAPVQAPSSGEEMKPRKPDPIWEAGKMWCPQCDSELWDTPRDGTYGPYHSCRGYKDKGCKYSINADRYLSVKMKASNPAPAAAPVGEEYVLAAEAQPAVVDDIDPDSLSF